MFDDKGVLGYSWVETQGDVIKDAKKAKDIREKGSLEKKELLKDKEGKVVKSRLDEVLLIKIALETGGAYSPAYGIQWGLANIYTNLIAKMEEKQLGGRKIRLYEDRYQIPLFIALILITLESLIGERTRKSKTQIDRGI